MSEEHSNDRAVKSTADDAILAKLSCVEKKYYEDPYIHSMSLGASGLVNKNRGNGNNSTSSRTQHSRYQGGGGRNASTNVNSTEPIIRKGTHARVKSIEKAIDAFLSLRLSCSSTNGNNDAGSTHDNVDRQIVILGAGRDTTYLRYRFQNNNNSNNGTNVNWYEVDHPSIIIQKAHSWLPNCIPKEYEYNCNVNDEYENSYSVTIALKENDDSNNYQMKNHQKCTSNYHLIGHDLRSPPSVLFDKLTHPNHAYNRSIPTLFILECVIMYLPDVASRELFHYIAQSPTSHSSSTHCDSTLQGGSFVAVVIYDPIPSNDRFGQLMIDNLQKVGIGSNIATSQQRQRSNNNNDDDNDDSHSQLSLVKTRTLQDQLTKLTQCGFDIATGCDMMDAYNYGIISTNERQRAARCEMLDELEEFVLLMKHYCLVVGVCSSKDDTADDVKANLDTTTTITANNRCVGYELCSVGEDSLMGFQDGRCMVVHWHTAATKNTMNNRQNFSELEHD